MYVFLYMRFFKFSRVLFKRPPFFCPKSNKFSCYNQMLIKKPHCHRIKIGTRVRASKNWHHHRSSYHPTPPLFEYAYSSQFNGDGLNSALKWTLFPMNTLIYAITLLVSMNVFQLITPKCIHACYVVRRPLVICTNEMSWWKKENDMHDSYLITF